MNKAQGPDDTQERPQDKTEPMVPVLCGCGWGRVAMPLSDVPLNCPLCGAEFHPQEPESWLD